MIRDRPHLAPAQAAGAVVRRRPGHASGGRFGGRADMQGERDLGSGVRSRGRGVRSLAGRLVQSRLPLPLMGGRCTERGRASMTACLCQSEPRGRRSHRGSGSGGDGHQGQHDRPAPAASVSGEQCSGAARRRDPAASIRDARPKLQPGRGPAVATSARDVPGFVRRTDYLPRMHDAMRRATRPSARSK